VCGKSEAINMMLDRRYADQDEPFTCAECLNKA
jgi:hypothetical protein